MHRRTVLALSAGALLGATIPKSFGSPEVTSMSDGAWCWFSDPRVIYSATHNRTYTGWVSPTGDIMARQIDHATGVVKTVVVHANLQIDDHCNPSFLEMPDGRVYIFYAHHQAQDVLYRWTGPDGDIGTMGGPLGLGVSGIVGSASSFSYANPVYLPACNRVMVFFRRNTDRNVWCVAVNENGFASNSWAGYALWDTGVSGSGAYFKVMSNGVDTDDMLMTTDQPAFAICDAYYAKFVGTSPTNVHWQNGLGTTISAVPFGPAQATPVQSGAAVGNLWIWQVARNANNEPIALLSTYPSNSTADHKYRFARWNGTAFVTSEICDAGGPLVTIDPPSQYYSGGICFDGDDKNRVYLSRQDAGGWHIESRITADNGLTWTFDYAVAAPLTNGDKYIRPFSPKGHGTVAPSVFVFAGPYTTYQNYNAALISASGPVPAHTYAAAPLYMRDDGLYFAGDGASRKQLATV